MWVFLYISFDKKSFLLDNLNYIIDGLGVIMYRGNGYIMVHCMKKYFLSLFILLFLSFSTPMSAYRPSVFREIKTTYTWHPDYPYYSFQEQQDEQDNKINLRLSDKQFMAKLSYTIAVFCLFAYLSAHYKEFNYNVILNISL